MLVFIIGPSGAGKSFLLDRVKPLLPGVAFVDLDTEEDKAIKDMEASQIRGWDGRWERGTEILRRLEVKANVGNPVVVDVGAGSLQTDAAFRYFRDRLANIILVTADKQVLCKRRDRTLDDLLLNEFTEHHIDLHASIEQVIDNSSEDYREAQERLLNQIASLLGR